METTGKKTSKQTSGFSLARLFRGEFFSNSFLTKNFYYILFVVAMIMVTMYNKFLTEKVINEINKTKNEVNALKAISVSNTAELMHLSKESVVIKMVQDEGLAVQPLNKPPEKIVIREKEN